MAQRRGFTVSVTRKGEVEYSRTWEDWNHACDDYLLSLHQNRMPYHVQLARLDKLGGRALPYAAIGGGVEVKIERAA